MLNIHEAESVKRSLRGLRQVVHLSLEAIEELEAVCDCQPSEPVKGHQSVDFVQLAKNILTPRG